tara:strand:+ start:596 stop:1735 length:1140 start_codon:yes stop_codon:yes gene_type:complete
MFTKKFKFSLVLIIFLHSYSLSEELIVKIGHVSPLSGQTAHLGKDNENGARMAIEDLNKNNLIISERKTKFILKSEDDAAMPQQGTAAAQKLVDEKVNGVIGHLNSGTTIPASKIYNDAGIPQVSPSATNPKYTQQGFKGAFRIVANDNQLGEALGKYAIDKLKKKNVAIIDDRTAYGVGVANVFRKVIKSSGGKIITRQYTNDKATDFNAILTNIKSKKPDLIFFGGMDAVAGPMIRQMKQLGLDITFMGGDGICTEQLSSLSGDTVRDNQVICAEAGGIEGKKKTGLNKFKERYKKRFDVNVKLYAPYAYDAVMLMATAMKKAESVDPKDYLDELTNIKYQGITGLIEFDKNGDIKNGALTMYTYKNGKRSKIGVIK